MKVTTGAPDCSQVVRYGDFHPRMTDEEAGESQKQVLEHDCLLSICCESFRDDLVQSSSASAKRRFVAYDADGSCAEIRLESCSVTGRYTEHFAFGNAAARYQIADAHHDDRWSQGLVDEAGTGSDRDSPNFD